MISLFQSLTLVWSYASAEPMACSHAYMAMLVHAPSSKKRASYRLSDLGKLSSWER
jgi:hypothetical protein